MLNNFHAACHNYESNNEPASFALKFILESPVESFSTSFELIDMTYVSFRPEERKQTLIG